MSLHRSSFCPIPNHSEVVAASKRVVLRGCLCPPCMSSCVCESVLSVGHGMQTFRLLIVVCVMCASGVSKDAAVHIDRGGAGDLSPHSVFSACAFSVVGWLEDVWICTTACLVPDQYTAPVYYWAPCLLLSVATCPRVCGVCGVCVCCCCSLSSSRATLHAASTFKQPAGAGLVLDSM